MAKTATLRARACLTRALPAVSFFVPGMPRGQGNHRTSRAGYIYETTKGHAQWRQAVADYARMQVRQSRRVIHGPCVLTLAFTLPPPTTLRRYPFPIRQRDGDASKLLRHVEDSLVVGGLLVDDKLIVDLAVSKRWGVPAGVQITVAPLIEELTLADFDHEPAPTRAQRREGWT